MEAPGNDELQSLLHAAESTLMRAALKQRLIEETIEAERIQVVERWRTGDEAGIPASAEKIAAATDLWREFGRHLADVRAKAEQLRAAEHPRPTGPS